MSQSDSPTRRDLARGILAASLTGLEGVEAATTSPEMVFPGVWRIRIGTPEKLTPVALRRTPPTTEALAAMPKVAACPIVPQGSVTKRGCLVSLDLAPREMVYGLGLQLLSFVQRGLKKTLRVNSDPKADTGDSHAPVPFYVTTNGYGVLVDTARYASFYCGNKKRKGESASLVAGGSDPGAGTLDGLLPAAYARFRMDEASKVLVEIGGASGVDVYVFGGPEMRDAVARYNLFSGGGCLPARWGLGFWYRAYGQFNQQEATAAAESLRQSQIPCDVLGLEPGWQSHAYSCSFVWSNKYPNPSSMLSKLAADHYRVNLWEHAFTHPTSPLYKPLSNLSGDYEVWGGLAPDFLLPEARQVFADFHEREHVARGVAGYKLDECDNSDFTRNWSFPEISSFPSGADGEQMHSLFGLAYQDTIQSVFDKRGQRTYGLVRSSHALASRSPYVLYSDLYEYKDFIRGLVNAGFSGLLWCPEVRDAESAEDLIRRLQTVVFSPLAMVNAWYIKNPPWKQVNQRANNAGEFAPGWQELESSCRELIRLRMRFVPYLYSAFVRYWREGLPPFRALPMDFPKDPKCWTIDDQYLMGDSLLVAPLTAGATKRDVYLPEGEWYDFWSGKKLAGGQRFSRETPLSEIPAYVKSGTLLPLAEPTLHTADPASWRVTVRVYGDGSRPCALYEDDGVTRAALRGVMNRVDLAWNASTKQGSAKRSGNADVPRYEVTGWEPV